jgi:hypothetical protein
MGSTPNDDRSDSMNPDNDAYWDSLDNHADQLNPNNGILSKVSKGHTKVSKGHTLILFKIS